MGGASSTTFSTLAGGGGKGKMTFTLFPPRQVPSSEWEPAKSDLPVIDFYPGRWCEYILIAWQTNVLPIYRSVSILGNYVKRQCPKLVKIKTVIFSSQVKVNQNYFSRLCLIQVSSPHLRRKEEWTSKLCKVLPQKSYKNQVKLQIVLINNILCLLSHSQIFKQKIIMLDAIYIVYFSMFKIWNVIPNFFVKWELILSRRLGQGRNM